MGYFGGVDRTTHPL